LRALAGNKTSLILIDCEVFIPLASRDTTASFSLPAQRGRAHADDVIAVWKLHYYLKRAGGFHRLRTSKEQQCRTVATLS
jgi:hypothetical protein